MAPRRPTISVIALLMTLFVAACGGNGDEETPGGAPGMSEDSIKIGVHTPLTGPASFVGQGFKHGAELAVQEINDNGGVEGRKIDMVTIDDEGTPEGASLAIRRLVDQEQAFLILGAGTSTSTVPQLQYFTQNAELPYYVSLASDPQVLEEYRPNVFSGATTTQTAMVEVFSDYVASEAGIKSVSLMQCDQGHCQAGVPLLRKALEDKGVAVKGVETYNSGATDFTGQINSILNDRPEAVFIYGLAEDGGRIIPQLRRSGFDGDIIGDTSLSDPSVVEVAGKAAEDLVTFWLASPQYIDETTGAMADWRKRFDAAFPNAPEGTPNLYSLMAYADTYVIGEGVRLAGEDPTRQAFNEALHELDGFVAGEDEHWGFAAPIGMPRSFSEDDHLGNETVVPVVARSGKFESVSGE